MQTEDWLIRTELMLGEKNLKKLKHSHVLIAGLGGVGSYAAEMIARTGIGEMTIVDSDIVQTSNINRQLIALHSTVGKDKTVLTGERLKDINPSLKLHMLKGYIKDEFITEVLDRNKYDYIVDAIDTLSPKIYLIFHGLKRNNRIVSSMGAGGKLDPTMVRVADISETHTCKFASDIRKRLRRLEIETGFKAVYSSEVVPKNAIIATEDKNKKSMVGTISYMPAVFGCVCASVVVRDLIES